ncbi:MAG: hypothetical protein R3C49_04625 [Planctomycetaceae bacterium]
MCDSSEMTGPETRRELGWKRLVMWTTFGLGCPLIWLAWQVFRSPAPLVISYATTRLTEPLQPDGRVDYPAAIQHLDLIGSSEAERLWQEIIHREIDGTSSSNPYVDPMKVLTRKVPAGEVSWNLAKGDFVPWTPADQVEIAAAIEANKSWYTEIQEVFALLDRPDMQGRSKKTDPLFGQFSDGGRASEGIAERLSVASSRSAWEEERLCRSIRGSGLRLQDRRTERHCVSKEPHGSHSGSNARRHIRRFVGS